MFKKIIIGFLCFLILAGTGIGIYLYTLDWNKHKASVAQRLSEITGLKTVIEGDLSIKLIPTPKFSAGIVKFTKLGIKDPLIVVNNISANAELIPLFSNKFILSGMTLSNASVDIVKDENGKINWSDFSKGGKTKAGDIEVSFNDIKMLNAVISYKDKQSNKNFNIPNINGTINATSLKGPFRVNGRFIHNNNEISFNGDVINGKDIAVRMTLVNNATSSKISLDGTVTGEIKGTTTFETNNLFDFSNIVFGENSIPNKYAHPLFVSFQYSGIENDYKLDNFTLKYAENTAGSGTVSINNNEKIKILTDIDMIQFDLAIIEDILTDIRDSVKGGKDFTNSSLNNYDAEINIKANNAWFRETNAQNLVLGFSLNEGIINVNRFGLILAGDTDIKTTGKIALLPEYSYNFDNNFTSSDIKSFASILNIDLTKYAKKDDKKAIFKNAKGNIQIEGNIENIKVALNSIDVDAMNINGNLGFIFGDETKHMVAYLNVSKVLFDKYINFNSTETDTFKDKLVYQFNLIPWKNNFDVDGVINIENGVYNDTAFNNMNLEFLNVKENIEVKKLTFENIGGAELSLKTNIDNIYTEPFINELTYDIKTNNFPMFISSIGLEVSDLNLFKNKLFASQGAINGYFSSLNMSTIQKFDDIEFTYTGIANKNENNQIVVDGDLELKSSNFNSLLNDLNIQYKPNIPVSNFVLSGKIVGSDNLFMIDNLNAYLGANNIVGKINVDKTTEKTKLQAKLDFDNFNVNHLFNLDNNKNENNDTKGSFIAKPNWNSNKIDYSSLKDIDFDIDLSSKKVIFDNNTYYDATLNAILLNNVLNVKNLYAKLQDSDIKLNFVLDSNNIAKINGNFDIKNLVTNDFCGSVYCLGTSKLSLNGNFSSIATTEEMFINNLNSSGKFNVSDITIRGWDMDIIKFEFEQRKTANGFLDTVLASLKSGKTNFEKVGGDFNITKGVVIADNVTWSSPVVDMSSNIEFNIEKWDMATNFEAIYKNATFSDILKFKLNGNVENPTVEVDINDTIKKLNKYEQNLLEAKGNKEREKIEAFNAKKQSIIDNLKLALNDLGKMTLDIIRFKPLTNDSAVQNVYNSNIEKLQRTEQNLNILINKAENSTSEKELLDIDSLMAKDVAGLKFIPKTLEDNFIVDSKIIFDETFNKLAWLYDVARNNASYYNGLADVYMTQVEILDKSDNPISKETKDKLKADIKKIADDLVVISELQAKIRDNYLNIIDTATITTMNNNNEVAKQAVETMLTYLNKLNENIVTSIDIFRNILNINAKDYDTYLVYPPKDSKDIVPTSPTLKTGNTEKPQSTLKSNISNNNLSIKVPVSGLSDIIKPNDSKNNFASVKFGGLSNIITAKDKLSDNNVGKRANVNFDNMNVGIANIITKHQNTKISDNNLTKETIKELKKDDIIKEPLEDVVVATNTVAEDINITKVNNIEEIKVIEDNINNEIVNTIDNIETKDTKTTELNTFDKKDVQKNNNENEDIKIAKISIPNENTSLGFIEKTKDALKGLMAKIRKTEETVVEKIDEKTIEAQKVENEEVKVVDNTQVKPDEIVTNNTVQNNMTVNPVIAMNIGKHEDNDIDESILSIKEKKKGFGFKNNFNKNIIDNSDDNEAVDNMDEQQIVASNEIKPKVDTSNILKNLVSYDDNFKVTIRDASKDAPLYLIHDDEEIIEKDTNKYIFKLKNDIVLSGDINKSMLKNKLNKENVSIQKQYLFKAMNKTTKTSGAIGKKFALSVK